MANRSRVFMAAVTSAVLTAALGSGVVAQSEPASILERMTRACAEHGFGIEDGRCTMHGDPELLRTHLGDIIGPITTAAVMHDPVGDVVIWGDEAGPGGGVDLVRAEWAILEPGPEGIDVSQLPPQTWFGADFDPAGDQIVAFVASLDRVLREDEGAMLELRAYRDDDVRNDPMWTLTCMERGCFGGDTGIWVDSRPLDSPDPGIGVGAAGNGPSPPADLAGWISLDPPAAVIIANADLMRQRFEPHVISYGGGPPSIDQLDAPIGYYVPTSGTFDASVRCMAQVAINRTRNDHPKKVPMELTFVSPFAHLLSGATANVRYATGERKADFRNARDLKVRVDGDTFRLTVGARGGSFGLVGIALDLDDAARDALEAELAVAGIDGIDAFTAGILETAAASAPTRVIHDDLDPHPKPGKVRRYDLDHVDCKRGGTSAAVSSEAAG